MKNDSRERKPHLTHGSAIDDLAFSPSEALEIRVKAELYRDLLLYIKKRALSQQELAATLNIHQPDVSNFLNGKISKFSVGKLLQFAGKLNLVAQVKIKEPGAAKLPRASALARRTLTQQTRRATAVA